MFDDQKSKKDSHRANSPNPSDSVLSLPTTATGALQELSLTSDIHQKASPPSGHLKEELVHTILEAIESIIKEQLNALYAPYNSKQAEVKEHQRIAAEKWNDFTNADKSIPQRALAGLLSVWHSFTRELPLPGEDRLYEASFATYEQVVAHIQGAGASPEKVDAVLRQMTIENLIIPVFGKYVGTFGGRAFILLPIIDNQYIPRDLDLDQAPLIPEAWKAIVETGEETHLVGFRLGG